jgi:DegV family protein with EDD domain
MSKIGIITDSSAFLPPGLVEEYDIRVVPLTVLWGEKSYLDGVDITTEEFYRKLKESSVHPTTTQPNPEVFSALYQEMATEYDGVVATLISSELSGTVSSAITAAEQFDRIPVRVVDSKSTSMGLGLATLSAARAAKEGASIDEVEKRAQEICSQVRVLFVVDTLEYLHRGGRIGGASKLVGTALSIKPLLHLAEGRVDALENVRTKRKALGRMLELQREYANGRPVHAAVIHASAPEEADAFQSEVGTLFDCKELYKTELSPVIATHAGPGTIGLAICPSNGSG